jgi:hypothetical protein
MVTNYPDSLASQGERLQTEDGKMEGFSGRILDWARQAMCGLHGHDTFLHYDKDRMSLRCVSCGYESPGWELNEARPTVTMRGDARRHALARPHLVSTRRIA